MAFFNPDQRPERPPRERHFVKRIRAGWRVGMIAGLVVAAAFMIAMAGAGLATFESWSHAVAVLLAGGFVGYLCMSLSSPATYKSRRRRRRKDPLEISDEIKWVD